MMEVIPYGEAALLVNFPAQINSQIHEQVLALHRSLTEPPIPGIRFSIPAYCSLTLGFDPTIWTFESLRDRLLEINRKIDLSSVEIKIRVLSIPVCYDPNYAWDMAEIIRHTQLSRKAIIDLHCSTIYRVYMLGFLPGFPYMGTIASQLACPRKSEPRTAIEPGCVGLAGLQTGIYPSKAPGGWQIIGRTPIRIFTHEKADPFLFRPGDQVRFFAISKEEYESRDWNIYDPLSKNN
ncbi:MAG: 5-oxoprolinase subunit PxpB [Bacteroidota bacterium]